MFDWLTNFFNTVGGLVLPPLPAGVGYWLFKCGAQSLVGGLITGLTISLTASLAAHYGGALTQIFKIKNGGQL